MKVITSSVFKHVILGSNKPNNQQTNKKAKQTNKQTNITRRMFDANSIAAKMEQHVSGVIKA